MVVFTCNTCGESLKKNRVEKHFQSQCRKPINVSCMDCTKDFRGNDYSAHTKCITEDEKYSAKGFVPKSSSNKGERKQEEWLDIVRSVQQTEGKKLGEAERNLLNTLSQHDNIPRKKKQFQNFIKNISHNISSSAVEKIWEVLDEKQKFVKHNNSDNKNNTNNSIEKENDDTPNVVEEQSNEDELQAKLTKKERKKQQKREKYEQQLKEIENEAIEGPETQDGEDEPRKKKKKSKKTAEENGDVKSDETTDLNGANNSNQTSKKRSLEQEEGKQHIKKKRKGLKIDADGEDCGSLEVVIKPSKFNWEETILKALAPKGELPIKRLRKKVLNEYQNIGSGIEINKEKVIAKFNKKLLKVVGVKVTKEVVTLIS